MCLTYRYGLSFLRIFFIIGPVLFAQELPPSPSDLDKNWVSSVSYDFSGQTIGKSVGYFNDLGKSTQSQSWDILTGKVWASQTLYDYHGRPAFNSLSAPKGLSFGYKNDFILNQSNGIYTTTNFESNPDTPQFVLGTTPNTLGHFYSVNYQDPNYPNQDVTSYPFSRTVYSTLNPGSVKKVLGGNKINGQWMQSYNFSMPAAQELSTVKAFGIASYNDNRITKTISRDVHGVETVVFIDSEGNTLAVARSGNEDNASLETYLMTSKIKEQGFVDIHIPVGCSGLTITNNPTGQALKIYDLVTETQVYTSVSVLPSGFYRLVVNDLNSYEYNPSNPVTLTYNINYYDYSLNKYDRAGRLLSSSQPIGTEVKSTFKYNSLGQLLQTTSPDEGEARFVYRTDGQIRFSRNVKQKAAKEFSYTNYDEMGRPVESGVYYGQDLNPDTYTNFTNTDYYQWFSDTVLNLTDSPDGLNDTYSKEQHFTLYDVPDLGLDYLLSKCNIPSKGYKQTFLYGNVSRTKTENPQTNTTWYSYDVYGRVKWLVQKPDGQCFNTIDYTYDPITGQVIKVDYQRHVPSERFIHQYKYNTAGQLVEVNTSTDDIHFTNNAKYYYTETGALRRTELAEDLQGIDYVYNINGQLKAINSPHVIGFTDPGNDSPSTTGFKEDVFGMIIDYHIDDYNRKESSLSYGLTSTSPNNQFNGNIGSIRWNNAIPSAPTADTYNYSYNKNNWLSGAVYGTSNAEEIVITDINTGQPYNTGKYKPEFTQDANQDYEVSNITYDENGNIVTLKRNGVTDTNGNNAMDEFTYHYKEDKNQLTAVEDTNDNSNPIRFNDLKNQYLGPAVDNYIYNSIGQLEVSLQDEMAYEYNASGLVTKINGFASTSTNDWTSLYENDFSLATDNDVNNWDYEAPNGSSEIPLIRINYINSGIVPVGGEGIECTVVNTRYTSCVSLSMDAALVRGHYRTVPNALHKLDMDVIVQHSQTLGGQVIPAGAIIRVKDANGNVLASQVYNSPNPSLSPDPDMVCGPNPPPRCNDTDCDNFFDEHASFQFTPTTDTIVVEVERDGQWGNIYLDNIHLQVATETKLAFFYNDRGHRIRKESYLSTNAEVTYYVRDVSGSVMSIYTKSGQGQVEQKEIPVYGASRLGVYYTDEKEGGYVYQITDHLGNVRAVVLKDGNNALSLTNRTDYYPFGMPMPNKNIEGDYRYGYQGEFAEKEPELGGGINSFEARLWDSRIGRWLTVDLAGEFFSPYLGMGNNPISVVDPDGRCTVCPDDAKQGDTFNHPEFGEMQYDEFLGWNISGASMLDTVIIGGDSSGGFNPIMFQPIPIGPTGGFTTLAEIKSFFTANSGSTMYGNGSDNQMSRKGSGEIYGTWDFNEMVIPGSPGPSITRWSHTPNFNKAVDLLENFSDGMSAGEHIDYVAIQPLLAPSDKNTIITRTIIVKQYFHDIPTRTTDSIDESRTFTGQEKRVNFQIDSTKKSHKSQYRNRNYFDN